MGNPYHTTNRYTKLVCLFLCALLVRLVFADCPRQLINQFNVLLKLLLNSNCNMVTYLTLLTLL